MSVTLVEPAAALWLQPQREQSFVRPILQRIVTSTWWWVTLIATGQIVMALRPGHNKTAFEDEGLYVYMGHRMIDHWLHGSHIKEYPGSYFSGAPGFYPVIAAIGDYFGGLNGARLVSTVFAIIAMVCVCGLGTQLFGKVAGVIGAAFFAANGSVIMLSHFATYDALMMAFVAGAAWLSAYSAKQDLLVWVPAIWVLLACAFFAKYAGALYIPIIALLAAAVGWRELRWVAVKQAALIVLGTVALIFAVIAIDGQSLIHGVVSTTVRRHVLNYGSTTHMIHEVRAWIGPWLLLAGLGAVWMAIRRPRQIPTVLALMIGSVAGIADQMHMHEETSFSKHVAFGLIFAAPLIGALLSAAVNVRWRVVGVASLAAAVYLLATVAIPSGSRNSRVQLSFWVEDSALTPVLEDAIARTPNKHILGESPSPEKYALRKKIRPDLWNDTYQLFYKGQHGYPAFHRAVMEDHFGVIYLTMGTVYGKYVQHMLATKETRDYKLLAKVPRYRHNEFWGYWLVYGLIHPTVGE